MYHTCEHCGANLDPDEKCDCQDKLEQGEAELQKMMEVDNRDISKVCAEMRFFGISVPETEKSAECLKLLYLRFPFGFSLQ